MLPTTILSCLFDTSTIVTVDGFYSNCEDIFAQLPQNLIIAQTKMKKAIDAHC